MQLKVKNMICFSLVVLKLSVDTYILAGIYVFVIFGYFLTENTNDLKWMQIAFWSISILGYLFFTIYENYIGAFLAIPLFRPPVSGIEEILYIP